MDECVARCTVLYYTNALHDDLVAVLEARTRLCLRQQNTLQTAGPNRRSGFYGLTPVRACEIPNCSFVQYQRPADAQVWEAAGPQTRARRGSIR